MKKDAKPRCLERRRFLGNCAGALATVGSGLSLQGCGIPAESETRIVVPEGFEPRLIARSGYPTLRSSEYLWHDAPDGGGCFATADGGWIYVSNSEMVYTGGVGALRFDADGRIVDTYPAMSGTIRNCAGGVTPWGTWLSCEEIDEGRVWECDPLGVAAGIALPALGVCKHESAAVDPASGRIYLTEDESSGGLYRFTPSVVPASGRPDLDDGLLEIARVEGDLVSWAAVPDPAASDTPMRDQLSDGNRFHGAEGISIFERNLRFTTKKDNRIWQLGLDDDRLEVLHHLSYLTGSIDALTHTSRGEMMLAEEGGEVQILYFSSGSADPVTLARLPDHGDSEVTGLAFDPSETRLYFSSQRGNTGKDGDGLTFELRGDFSTLAGGFRMTMWVLDHRALNL